MRTRYFDVAYSWLAGWQDAQPKPIDDIARIQQESQRTSFALAWEAYRQACKASDRTHVYILTAWEQWRTGRQITG